MPMRTLAEVTDGKRSCTSMIVSAFRPTNAPLGASKLLCGGRERDAQSPGGGALKTRTEKYVPAALARARVASPFLIRPHARNPSPQQRALEQGAWCRARA